MKTPLISICIPAYKNEAYLKRLLDSIGEQSFKDFEVIVTDDSNSDAIRLLCARYQSAFDLSYYGNPSALGSPENWNESIRKANGEWIKIMHDDDWFVDKGSLKKFALKAGDGKVDFIFSGYYNINLDTGKKKKFTLNQFQNFLLRRNPLNLLKRNLIGHPSTTLIKNTQNLFFDKDFKWLVDIDYYIRVLKTSLFLAIKEPLINIGISSEQITKKSFRNPEVEIPENLKFLNKMSPAILKNILVYDHYWRFVRNLSIRDEKDLKDFYDGTINSVIKKMVKHQSGISRSLLNTGFFSKLFMTGSYLINWLTGKFRKE